MSETDSISRQAAIAEFSCCELTPDGGNDVNYAIDFLKQMPSAQLEIIRCKDCIYFDKDYDEETADWCHAWSETTSEDGYCHNAERGEEKE